MENSSSRNEKKTDAAKEALTYWIVSVLFTLFPTLASIGVALYLSKPLAVSNDEITMLACLVLLPTLLDYFRDRDKSNHVHTVYFSILLMFLAFLGMIYGIARANDQKEATFASVFLMALSVLFSYAAEMVLRGQIKMDMLQKTLTILTTNVMSIAIFLTLWEFIFSKILGHKSVERPEKTIDVFVNGRKVKGANLKADDIAELLNRLDADEVAALKKRIEKSDERKEDEKKDE